MNDEQSTPPALDRFHDDTRIAMISLASAMSDASLSEGITLRQRGVNTDNAKRESLGAIAKRVHRSSFMVHR
jgi:hypothetical protein